MTDYNQTKWLPLWDLHSVQETQMGSDFADGVSIWGELYDLPNIPSREGDFGIEDRRVQGVDSCRYPAQ